MRIAMLTYKFPTISETFILNQITGLLDRGHEVEIIAREGGPLDAMHPDIKTYRLLDRTTYLQMPRNPQQQFVEGSKIIGKLLRWQATSLVQIINHLLFFHAAKALRLVF